LEKDDFVRLAQIADPHIDEHGSLAGFIIETPSFPGWENPAGMATHFRFVRAHHRRIKRVAIVTNSLLMTMVRPFAALIVSPGIRRFHAGQREAALRWVLNRS
jgi:hypothetical protein